MRTGFASEISDLLGMRGCGRKILELLEKKRDGLTVRELLTKGSERGLRGHIKRLRELNLIKTVEIKTRNNRRAHLYITHSPDKVAVFMKRLVDEKIGCYGYGA